MNNLLQNVIIPFWSPMRRSQTQSRARRGRRRGVAAEPSSVASAERKTIVKEREEGEQWILRFGIWRLLGSTEMEAAGEEEQDGLSIHSAGQGPPSSVSSLPKFHQEQSQVEVELRLLEALEIYPPSRLQGIHRHFVLYGLMEYLRKSFDRQFTAEEVLQLLDRFYNLEAMKPEEEEAEILNKEDDFSLPQSFFDKDE
ncbi:uncharacterized protein LOC122050276 isoform X1 [Zingiber officinale]|uniref:uncharacterized protein LOC122050276 isoform X1 n=1 Tax=Zingiber officinale TaxID=94328 RepID=UPI001C4C579E|nr:uncharacterized protein LOC122050276 isoform X1 [Zingiber officinale]